MYKISRGYTALAAAITLACGTGYAQAQEREQQSYTDAEREAALEENLGSDVVSRRQELLDSAEEAMSELRELEGFTPQLLEQAYGYAVFDTTKGGFIVTGAGGTGVAQPRQGGEPTFMHLGEAGIGFGAGLENYKLVLLIADEQSYRDFISGQWDGSITAQAAAGEAGASAEEQFLEGITAYRFTDGGLMAQADVTATRFWPSDRLNTSDQQLAAQQGDRPQGESQQTESQQARSQRSGGERAMGPANPELFDELAMERDDLNAFVEAVRAAGLEDSLTRDTSYTVFAPTDEAFENIAGMSREEWLAPENREQLIALLRAHIVADSVDEQMARQLSEARTIDGDTVRLSADGDELRVGDATVLESNIERGNLHVYVVDGLVTQPSSQVALAEDTEDRQGANTADRSGARQDLERRTDETGSNVAERTGEAFDEAADETADAADEFADETERAAE